VTREEFLTNFPKLAQTYKPDSDVVAKLADIKLLVLVGPSGVGKSTIIENLGLPFVPSDTTRERRAGEVNGSDFFFLSDYDQIISDIKTGRFVQIAVGPAGDFYATRASAYPDSGWATMPVVADVVPTFRKLGFNKVLVAFVMPPSFEEWMRRLNLRPFSPQQLNKRLAEARRSFNFALHDQETSFILNDNIEDAINQIKELLDGGTNQEREAEARQAAKEAYNRIQDE
jgi:guanylate kinase